MRTMAGASDFDITAFLCVVCRDHQGSPVPFQYIFKGRTLRGVRCRQCSLIQVFPQPSAEETAELYQEEYFTCSDPAFIHGSTDHFSRAEAAEKGHYFQLMGKISEVSPTGKLLEIGSGLGHFLNYARAQGYDVLGVAGGETA